MIDVQNPLLSKLSAFATLTNSERASLGRFDRPRRCFEIGTDLMREGEKNSTAYILLDGWVLSYKLLRSGERQIVDFQVPGDFLGLRSLLLRTADHSIEPVTPIIAVEIGMTDLLRIFRESPRLAAAMLWALSTDGAVVVERLVSLGRRDAIERVAHFFLELGARLKVVGLATGDGYACPLSQYHLADALGLSAVHINRVLRQLREEELMTFRAGKVTFDNFDKLVQIAQFDTAYMDHGGAARE
ncbi:Crp/Fnr family transcriptional regulator [Pelagivirga sediminicola]|uniref:Crp/Fnr family transcriptional regulator n=1 Tax=Pelagivirga sediminicola TaxID=2170575 RepID=A0A2T7G4C7_9RHOB|nr:Crp/Fnr family transcriptional regulator [Pelagivirga sediminicola]PVA09240.1 Crp/Fnr family transcriptional regulator [Pelagivirga sediminicola]